MFRTIITVALLGGLALAGCTQHIQRSAAKVRAFDISLYAQRGSVSVRLAGSPEAVDVDYFSMAGDSAMWMDPKSGKAVTVPVSSLEMVTVRDRAEGMLYGMVGGIGIGLGVAYVSGDAAERTYARYLVAGEVLRAAAGAIIGKTQNYQFEGSAADR